MSFAAEDQLILALSHVEVPNAARIRASSLLRTDLDWNYILESTIQHAVAPLFWHGLKQVYEPEAIDSRVPPTIFQELQELYSGNRARNHRLYRVVGEIVREFSTSGIDLLGLKDVQLAKVVYPDLALRPIGDIDLLIRREQYQQVAGRMSALGFSPMPAPDIPYTLKYAWAHHFRRAEDNVWVDIQWNVMQMEWGAYEEGNFDFEIDRMWRGGQYLTIDNYEILVPRPEDMLFHLLMHLEGHRYCELILLCDIAEFLRHYEGKLDWTYLLSITQRYGVNSSVYYVLFVVRQLLGAPIPNSVLQQLTPKYFKANVFAPLFQNLTALHGSLDELRAYAAPLPSVMAKFETAARRQAVAAQQLYREVDAIASAFTEAGGEVLILSGRPSEKIYPDDALDAFEPLDLFMLERDLPLISEVLRKLGFEVDQHESDARKSWDVKSRDPLLADRPVSLRLSITLQPNLSALLAPARVLSKADTARKLLIRRMLAGNGDRQAIDAEFRIHAFSPEELLVLVAVQFANLHHDRLFGICTVLEFFRSYKGTLNWKLVEDLSNSFDVRQKVQQALGIVMHFDEPRLPTSDASTSVECRVLQSARYDIEQNSRYTQFKRGFYIALSLLSTQSARSKCKYVGHLLRREWQHPTLLAAVTDAVKSMGERQGKQRKTYRMFAYWIEAAPTQINLPSADDQQHACNTTITASGST